MAICCIFCQILLRRIRFIWFIFFSLQRSDESRRKRILKFTSHLLVIIQTTNYPVLKPEVSFQARGRLSLLPADRTSLHPLVISHQYCPTCPEHYIYPLTQQFQAFIGSTMAGLAVTFAVLFFLFNFNFTYGRTSDRQKNGVAGRHLSNSSPAQNSLSAIFLPVENIEFAPAQTCGPETEADDPKPLGHMLRLPIRSTKEVIVPQSKVKTSHPLSLSPPSAVAVVNFHPINRHFQLLPPFSDHFTPRHCRRRFFRPVISRFRSGGVSNGKDAALSRTNNVIRPVIYRGDSHRIPKRPVRLHEHRRHYDVGAPKVLFKHRHEFQNENPKKRFRHDDEKPQNEKRREEKKSDGPVERKEGRLTKRIRKFLNQF